MNFYEHHIGDWDSATAHLSLIEEAVYGRLVRIYYRSEKPIPADLKQAARLVRAQSKSEREAVQVILEEFFVLGQDGWHNRRCDAEIGRYRDKCEKASRSADARWKRGTAHTEGSAGAMRTHTEGNALQSPYTSNQERVSPSEVSLYANATRRESAAERHRRANAIADNYARDAIAAELASGVQRADAEPVSPDMDGTVVDARRVRAAAG